MTDATTSWPTLPPETHPQDFGTLHMWAQIVGKIRLACTPWTNHSWHVTLYLTARGLTTSPIPHRERSFQIDFDFIDHRLSVATGDGATRSMTLGPRTVADFYRELFDHLRALKLDVRIHAVPNEVPEAIPFTQDTRPGVYDADYVHRLWQAFAQADRVMKAFRTRFIGKCSPVHFFWGAFDLAVTRFSGRPAPPHPGGVPNFPDWVAREAYSHEVASCGFWPGGGPMPGPAFYAYAYPEPDGFSRAPVTPAGAYYHADLHEFVLPYDAVYRAPSPDAALLDFFQRTYEAAADLAHWDRAALEWQGPPRTPRK